MSVSWKQAPIPPSDEAGALLETLSASDIVIPAAALAALGVVVLLRRALRPRRKLRRLDPVLPYAHAEPE